MSSDDGMSSLPQSEEETEASVIPPTKKKPKLAVVAKKKTVKDTEQVKRKYVRKPVAKNVTSTEVSNVDAAWEIIKKTCKDGCFAIVVIPPVTPQSGKGNNPSLL